MHGLVHIYTGNGKGKTTAAIGLGVRAYGRGFRVLMVQFLKGAETGEVEALKKLDPGFVLVRNKSIKSFLWNMSDEEKKKVKKDMYESFMYAVSEAHSGKWDMLILDEVLGAINNELIGISDVIELITKKPENLEIVLTGRNAAKELIELADYVSDINAVKHPMDEGKPARKGIEY